MSVVVTIYMSFVLTSILNSRNITIINHIPITSDTPKLNLLYL